jgi:hypothetical protein
MAEQRRKRLEEADPLAKDRTNAMKKLQEQSEAQTKILNRIAHNTYVGSGAEAEDEEKKGTATGRASKRGL